MDIESIDTHFTGKEPNVRVVYDALMGELRKLGPVKESPKQTSIHLDRSTAFAAVSTRKSALILNFRNDYEIKNPRLAKVEKHSAHRWMHYVKLEQPDQIDAELIQWLSDAYALAA